MGGRGRRAVFLDRDGVLVADTGLRTATTGLEPLPGVAGALARLRAAGFVLVGVSNQAVLARGLLDEAGLEAQQADLEARLRAQGGPALDAFHFCPHHPAADLPRYRRDCDCRKPRPGLLLRAAAELGLDLEASFMVGDRPTDLQAGRAAGCRTAWVQTGRHLDPPIETREALDPEARADFTGPDLAAAAAWILEAR